MHARLVGSAAHLLCSLLCTITGSKHRTRRSWRLRARSCGRSRAGWTASSELEFRSWGAGPGRRVQGAGRRTPERERRAPAERSAPAQFARLLQAAAHIRRLAEGEGSSSRRDACGVVGPCAGVEACSSSDAQRDAGGRGRACANSWPAAATTRPTEAEAAALRHAPCGDQGLRRLR